MVRPASLVGPVSDALLPGLFEAVRLLAIRDARSHWQFCHVDDLLDALVAAALGTVTGAVTVGSEGWLTRAEVEAIAGMRSVVVPSSVAFASAERLHRVGALTSPSSDLHYLVHPWVVGSQRLRETGWQPLWTNEAALRDHLRLLGDRAGRSLVVVDRKDATRAAAGRHARGDRLARRWAALGPPPAGRTAPPRWGRGRAARGGRRGMPADWAH